MNKLTPIMLCLLSATVYANETQKNTSSTYKIDSVQVSATGLNPNQIKASKLDVRQAALLRDVLRDIPGVDVGGSNSMYQKIYMRGVDEKGLNITVDGARQLGDNFHHTGNLLVDPEMLKKVDVTAGSHSVTDGMGSLGGSVKFVTVDASDLLNPGQKIGAKVNTGFNTNNKEWQKSIAIYGQVFDKLDVLAYFNHKNYKRGKGGEGTVIGGDGKDSNLLLKAGLQINDANKITFSHEHTHLGGDKLPYKPEFFVTNPDDSGEYASHKYVRSTQTFNYFFNPENQFVDLNLNLYHTKHDLHWNRSTDGYMETLTKTKGGKITNKSAFETGTVGHTVRTGVEIFQSTADMPIDDNKSISLKKEKSDNRSIYVEDKIAIGSFTITPGLRYDVSKLTYQTGESVKHSHLSKALAARYDFDFGLSVFSSYTDVFSGANLTEVIRLGEGSTESRPSEPLKAEKGNNKEIGVSFGRELTENSALNFTAKAFRTDYDNLHGTSTAPGVRAWTKTNVGKSKVEGWEISANYSIEDFVANLSYSRSRFTQKDQQWVPEYKRRSKPPVLIGTKLIKAEMADRSQMGDKFTVGLGYTIPSTDLALNWNSIIVRNSPRYADRRDLNGKDKSRVKPYYSVHDFAMSWKPQFAPVKGLSATLGVYNIFDRKYASHTARGVMDLDGYADIEPGRTVKASISYKY